MIKFLKVLFEKLKERKKKKVKKVDAEKLQKAIPNSTVTKMGDGFFKIESTEELSLEDLVDIIKKHVEGE